MGTHFSTVGSQHVQTSWLSIQMSLPSVFIGAHLMMFVGSFQPKTHKKTFSSKAAVPVTTIYNEVDYRTLRLQILFQYCDYKFQLPQCIVVAVANILKSQQINLKNILCYLDTTIGRLCGNDLILQHFSDREDLVLEVGVFLLLFL